MSITYPPAYSPPILPPLSRTWMADRLARLAGRMEYRAAGTRLFKREQLLFCLQAPSIARELAVGADRAMTRDQDRHWIRSVGMSHGARRRRPPDACRD